MHVHALMVLEPTGELEWGGQAVHEAVAAVVFFQVLASHCRHVVPLCFQPARNRAHP